MPVHQGSLVLDTSTAACWCLEDEGNVSADAALARMETHGAIVPALFWFELRNVLLMAERRKRVSESQTARSLGFIKKMNVRIDREPDEEITMSLARVHRLTVYGSTYLELALRQILPLATLDGDLIRAAQAEKVELVGA